LWHERDISHSSVERVILPDSFIALDHMLRRMTRIVRGMVVNVDRMRENLNRSRGVVFSGTVLLELAKKGISREQAYEWVQRNAMRSFAEQLDFKTLLLADADVTRALPPAEIERGIGRDHRQQTGREYQAQIVSAFHSPHSSVSRKPYILVVRRYHRVPRRDAVIRRSSPLNCRSNNAGWRWRILRRRVMSGTALTPRSVVEW